jgi:hypothetical protein
MRCPTCGCLQAPTWDKLTCQNCQDPLDTNTPSEDVRPAILPTSKAVEAKALRQAAEFQAGLFDGERWRR